MLRIKAMILTPLAMQEVCFASGKNNTFLPNYAKIPQNISPNPYKSRTKAANMP